MSRCLEVWPVCTFDGVVAAYFFVDKNTHEFVVPNNTDVFVDVQSQKALAYHPDFVDLVRLPPPPPRE
jgi:hypothetical protein